MRCHKLSTLTLFPALFLCAAPVSAQLLHRYSFDGSGTVATDSVGSAHGTLFGGTTLAGTGAVDLDGTDDYVELPSGLVSGMGTATIEVWATWDGPATVGWSRIFDFGDNSGGAGGQGTGITYFVLSPRDNTNGLTAVAMKTLGTTSIKTYGAAPATVGVATHYAVVYDSPGDTMSLYVDGAFESMVTLSEDLTDLNDINCWLGQSQFINDPHFDGQIDEVRIYGGLLSAVEIAANAAAGPNSIGIGTNYCGPGVANSTGQSAEIAAVGSASVAANSLSLLASGLPTSQFAIFINSTSQSFVPNPGGSMGNLCLGAGLGRYNGPGQVQNSGMSGAAALALDLGMTPTPSGPTAIAVGQTWNFQAWYRDLIVGTGAVSNFTDAVSVTFN
jgi:hypothetical protein